MEYSMSFETKIISIPSETTLLIKGGTDEGINKGDEFRIISRGLEIIDPDTGDSLGTYDHIKATLEVTQVYPKFSELKHVVRKRPSVYSTIINSALSSTTTTTTAIQDLNVETSSEFDDLSPLDFSDNTIRVGDIAQQL